MQLNDLKHYKNRYAHTDFAYHYDLFTKPIWGDMGEDCASITITIQDDQWHLAYIRTQNGEPYPLAETVSNVIDRYEKDLSDDAFYDYLSMHQMIQDFMISIQKHAIAMNDSAN